MSDQMNLLDTLSATSSPASEDGATPSDSQDGQTTRTYGPDRALASLSARQAKEKGLLTSGTCGRHGSISSSSARLTSSLANRAAQLLSGSTLYALTWKRVATPRERLIYRLQASALRTNDSACGSWPTPNTPSGGRSMSTEKMDATGKTADGKKHTASLEHAAKFATWPTPNAGQVNDTDPNWQERRKECKERHSNGNGFGINLGMAAQLASPTTPTVRDHKDTGDMSESMVRKDGKPRNDTVPRQAFGTPVSGSTAQTESTGQLNPALSRWLMGYPPEWCDSAVSATRSSRS